MPYKFCVSTSTFLATPFPPDMCAGTWTGVCPHLKTCGRSHHLWSPLCPCHDTGMVQSSVCAGFGSGFICTPSLASLSPLHSQPGVSVNAALRTSWPRKLCWVETPPPPTSACFCRASTTRPCTVSRLRPCHHPQSHLGTWERDPWASWGAGWGQLPGPGA